MTAAATPAEVCAAVDSDRLQAHLEEFARRIKLSGSTEERESFAYLQSCLDGFGFTTRLLEHDAYISLPGYARLDVSGETPDCITHSFSRSSPEHGLRATLVYAGAGTAADFAQCDVTGKIVLLENIANPGASLRASQAGALGQIHISPHEHLHEMCISSVWGNPSEARLDELPTTVVLSVRNAVGERLKARLAHGETIEAGMHAQVDTGWRKTPILEADIMPDGAGPQDDFVMFSGHHDTWYYGVMDNGGANATMLEVGRLAAARRSVLQRGLRLAFWSGHSHGRYSGSAWYADNRWEELERRCVAHVNIDSVGGIGRLIRADAPSSAELYAVAAQAVHEHTGEALVGHRMARAGDQSFWGIGVPSVLMMVSEQPLGGANPMAAVLGAGSGRTSAGFGWWWHTPDDTLDKIDRDNHLVDTRIYAHAVWRLLTDRVLPLDYGRQVVSLRAELTQLAVKAGEDLDVEPLLASLATLAERLEGGAKAEPAALNRALIAVSRALVPIDYTHGDRFDHGPALGHNPYPVLDPVRRLAEVERGSDAAKFAAVAAQRALNRVAHAIAQATDALASL